MRTMGDKAARTLTALEARVDAVTVGVDSLTADLAESSRLLASLRHPAPATRNLRALGVLLGEDGRHDHRRQLPRAVAI